MSTARRLAVLGTALAGALVVTAPGASASGSICNDGHCAAKVEFKSTGEIFVVHDMAPDRKAAVGEIEFFLSGQWQTHWVWNTKGYAGPPVSVNYSLPEGTPVRYAACLGESTGEVYDCSWWREDTA